MYFTCIWYENKASMCITPSLHAQSKDGVNSHSINIYAAGNTMKTVGWFITATKTMKINTKISTGSCRL